MKKMYWYFLALAPKQFSVGGSEETATPEEGRRQETNTFAFGNKKQLFAQHNCNQNNILLKTRLDWAFNKSKAIAQVL